jgi:hypothetical protein
MILALLFGRGVTCIVILCDRATEFYIGMRWGYVGLYCILNLNCR